VGAGWTCRRNGRGQVSVSFFGDGAANEGAFHEALNLAAVWNLPVIFVCENNRYGFSTHYRRTMRIEDIAARAAAYGMPGKVVDGMDVLAVHAAAAEAVERARTGGGPTLLECKTYRFMGHSRFENPTYRSKDELAQWKTRDPIPAFRRVLLEQFSLSPSELADLERDVTCRVEAAVTFAETSPDPCPTDYQQFVYAPQEAT
jgi:TPP-dependent pyruvate/acetoin dehydrogenase alpha subunit